MEFESRNDALCVRCDEIDLDERREIEDEEEKG